MMNSSRYVRCDTILAAAARAGRKVAMVTAKEKLRDLLTKDLDGIAFSSERAAAATVETHGIVLFPLSSFPDLSRFFHPER